MLSQPQHAKSGRAGDPCEWAGPPPVLQLAPGEVHVWRAFLEIAEPEFHRIASALSADEHSRAERFRFPADRRAFLVSRAVLRSILGRYLGESPAKVSFVCSEQGKPALTEAGTQWLRFNASHSHGLGLYAVAREREVGVDVERMQPELATWQVAAEFLAQSEIRALGQVGDEQWARAFFACWTRKEAYLKARGSGLAAPLNSFAVPVDPAFDGAVTLENGTGVWSLQSLDAGDCYAAACAAQGSDWRMCLWQWSPDKD